MTGIFNRSYFEEIFEEFNEKVNKPVAIILCDLDELKYVNDNFGHKEGDILIKSTAELLNEFSSDNVTVARIGGDEFAIVVSDIMEEEAKELIQSIYETIENYNEDGLKRKIKLSIGYAYTYDSIGNMTKLFSQADSNMYEVKSKRKQKQIV
jgi:diguanylate cyclase (GGDEF)-like protein